MKTITALLISILFIRELIVINQDFVIYTNFIILLLISIKAFTFLTNNFHYIRIIEQDHIKISSMKEQLEYYSQHARSVPGLDSPHMFVCNVSVNTESTH
jgi:hypothetical protein